jgi:alkylhydroperoxidase family enzyme
VVYSYRKEFYERLFYASQVDIQTQELLRCRLAGVHGCAYSNRDDHLPAAKASIARDKVVRPDAPCFGEKERAIIELADQLSCPNMHGELTGGHSYHLSKHYSDGDIYELGAVDAVLTGMAKMLFVYDLVKRAPNRPIVSLSDATE